MRDHRPYIFYEFTRALCHECMQRVDAKIIFQDEKVFMVKNCHDPKCANHGETKVLLSTDIEYYKSFKDYYKPGDMPEKWSTETINGCPYDCGVCPDHEQHACLSVVEITDKCNLTCPVCYAGSSPNMQHKSFETVCKLFDTVCAHEGEPDVVQISGGEPTIHPDFWKILDEAKKRPFRYIMVNTNGIEIARNEEFAKRLASYQPNFEIYLQFDSFDPEYLVELRGVDLTSVRIKALENLNKYNVSTTLVVVVKKDKNDHEIGKIIDFALSQPCVRGVTFQPVQVAGRTENWNLEKDRLTISDVRRSILDQTNYYTPDDLVPLPCHPENICMGYALRGDAPGELMPLNRYMPREALLEGASNTIMFEKNPEFQKKFFELFSLGVNGESTASCFGSVLCCLPQVRLSKKLTYDKIFRILIIGFMDKYDLDLRSVKRACIMMPTPDGKMIPFDTYNMFYRQRYSLNIDELNKFKTYFAEKKLKMENYS